MGGGQQIPAITPVVIGNDPVQYRFDQTINAELITFPYRPRQRKWLMENSQVLKRQCFRRIWKTFVIGAIFGGLLSVAVHRLFCFYAADESEISNLLTAIYSVTEWSAYQLHDLTGLKWPPGGNMIGWRTICVVAGTNAIITGTASMILKSLHQMWINRSQP